VPAGGGVAGVYNSFAYTLYGNTKNQVDCQPTRCITMAAADSVALPDDPTRPATVSGKFHMSSVYDLTKDELIPKNHHICARNTQNHHYSAKLQKTTGFAKIRCNVH
jgi:hypothetical protein